jgi:hypothetical protein
MSDVHDDDVLQGEYPYPSDLDDDDTCGRCHRRFDPTDTAFDGRAQYRDTRFCRSCVDRCHESTDFAHTCAICARQPAG